MPGLDAPQGFWLLLLVPLLIFLDRWRSRPRTVVLSTFLIVASDPGERPKPPPLFFRIRRRYRVYVAAAAVVMLSLAFAGAHLNLKRSRPTEYLLVLDNTAGMARAHGAGSLLSAAAEAIGRSARSLDPRHSLALLVTSPSPRILSGLSAGAQEALGGIMPSASSPPVAELVPFIESLLQGREQGWVLLISARSEEWRRELAGRQGGRISVLPDREVLTGNSGIVAFDLRPSAQVPDSFDLYAQVAYSGTNRPPALSLSLPDGSVRPVELPSEEPVEAFIPGLFITEGELVLSLAGGDTLSLDDRVRARVSPVGKIRVALKGQDPGLLRQALATYEGFVLAEEGQRADVDLFMGLAPDPLERPTLVVRPEGAMLDLAYRRIWENPGAGSFNPSHPVTRNVSFFNFLPGQVLELAPPEDFEVLARAGDVPVVLAGIRGGQRLVVWCFDPLAGGIHLDPSFLILLRGTMEWLSGQAAALWERTGCRGSLLEENAASNLLCREATLAAGSLSIPRLDLLTVSLPVDERTERVDLARALLAAALFLVAYLAVVNVYATRGEP